MKKYVTALFFAGLSLLIVSQAVATPTPLMSSNQIHLEDHLGRTFLQTMLTLDDGVIENFDRDYETEYKFASWSQVRKALDKFDRKNYRRVVRAFDRDFGLMKEFTQTLRREEKTFTPANVSTKVGRILRKMEITGANKYALGQFFALASGAGTLIVIDEDNYFYNIGYYAPEVRSGRSYGATTLHKANDASHLMYLRELEHFLEEEQDPRLFYEAMMAFLTDTDVSVYEYDDEVFSHQAEAVLTDYITVYTAELRRHLMKKLHPYRAPWGNDMTEATFLSSFNVNSGLMMLEGELTEASIKQHWALSKTGSGRSGFGINRRDRRKLQGKISNYYRYHKNKSKRRTVKAIDKLIGKKKSGDVYRAVMEFLNNKKNIGNASRVENVEDQLSVYFVDFLMDVYEDTDAIVAYFNAN